MGLSASSSDARAELTDSALTYPGKVKPSTSAEIRAAGYISTSGIGGETGALASPQSSLIETRTLATVIRQSESENTASEKK